ncbi:MAG: SusC/RagA family TonB-linked outer membrane protein [Candidatus Pseudobacter hemicellulosilyticus]|uniref:SusC/RagA family TonB-linked outer membrane protein n=1 Tax=Candidatus Pseudobacter hemicellulosilyticus TaxID=3121375 RepID=A0AAJ5WQI5_9BACT|nr:MAG: SusC/RagA family TonB-linked outer membrane protein [Pseudobacter sp.]
MKLTAIFLLTLLLKANAEGYAQKVTLSETGVSLESVFKKITKQTGYVFFYEDNLLRGSHSVSIEWKDMPLSAALLDLLYSSPFDYLIGDKTIAIKRKPAPSEDFVAAYRKTLPTKVSGKVIDAVSGEPIVGASIFVVAAQTGVRTDSKGDFTIIAPPGSVITISYVGYQNYEYKITRDEQITIRLLQKPQEMKTTVVTGIFNRKQSSYTGSAVTITNEELRKVGNANVFQALKNIAPAMVLDNFALGSNPNALPNIQLRGTSTFPADMASTAGLKGNYVKNPNEPLFILDGFEATIERIFDLDINRIERVTILKDAASKAIYGARAANGVVVIETKKNPSSKALITYNASVDVDLPDLTSYNLTNAREKLLAETIDGMYTAKSNYDPASEQIALNQLYNSRKKLAEEGLNTHWMAKPLRDGIGQKHTLGVELGGDALNVLADFSYRQVNGVMKGSDRTNISGNITTSYRVRNLLFRNIMSATSNSNTESPYGQFNDYAIMNPYWRAVNEDGTIPFYAELGPNGERITNPLYNASLNSKVATSYFNFTNNFYLEWTLRPGLRAIARMGIDVKNSDADEFYPGSHTMFDGYTSEELAKRRGRYQINNGKSTSLSGDLNLNYTREVGDHFFFANAGFNVREDKYNELMHVVEGFTSERMENVMLGRGYLTDSRPTGIDGVKREIGFLGAFSYMYDNRFMTDLTLRTSASSQFGAEKRWAEFWSVGLGWNLHNERFFENSIGVLDQFKIRGSIGSTGDPNFASNASIATYQYHLESLYQGFPGSYLANMPNAGLQWQTKFDYNAGLDAKIHNLTLRFDYYESYTENLVTTITLPGSTGFNSVKDNLGKVKNQGIEAFASWLVWTKGRSFVSVNAGIETNKNRIVELSSSMKAFNDRMDAQAADKANNKPVKKYQDGMSMNAIWAVPSLGIDPATGNEIYVKQDGSTTYIWDPSDLVVVGNDLSTYQGTFGINAEYNGFGINVTARYLGGGQLYNQTLVDKVENVNMLYNVDKRVLTGRWLQPGQQALFKRLGTFSIDRDGDGATSPEQEMTRPTSRFVQDRRELDIAAVNVYYLFSDNLVRKLGMQRLRVAFNMNEVAKFSSIRIERGTQYPFARTLSFSLSANF